MFELKKNESTTHVGKRAAHRIGFGRLTELARTAALEELGRVVADLLLLLLL